MPTCTATDPLAAACPQCKAAVGERCKNYRGTGCAPHRLRWAAASEAPTEGPLVCRPPTTAEQEQMARDFPEFVKPIDLDFDENFPPPRARPQGPPVPRFVKLLPGESVLGAFRDWDVKGRIPEGSVLCDFVGTGLKPLASGYVVAAISETSPPELRTALGTVGQRVPLECLEGYVVAVNIRQVSKWLVVFSPRSVT